MICRSVASFRPRYVGAVNYAAAYRVAATWSMGTAVIQKREVDGWRGGNRFFYVVDLSCFESEVGRIKPSTIYTHLHGHAHLEKFNNALSYNLRAVYFYRLNNP